MIPEILSPAGGFEAALAAFQYGADAVYLGLPRFSARADADNITPERLRTLLAYARSFSPPKKIYITFNTLVQDAELPQAIETLDVIDELAPDGVIVQDIGVARLIREHFPRLALHASTQLAAHNLDGVLALKALGFTRVVLARELTLEEIRHIVRESGVEIEIFVHGALCYSVSGLCLFSSHTAGRSGNRGRCAYCCREAFSAETPTSPGLHPPLASSRYPFSMKDLALAPILEAVVATGAHSLKIEGRMKSPLYVACVTDYYRQKLDGRLSPEAERVLIQDLQTVFSRPWTRLYAEGDQAAPASIIDPVAVGHRGALIGRAEAVIRDREGTRWMRFTSNRSLEKHDGLQVELSGGGKPFGCAVNLLRAVGSQRTVISMPAGSTVEVALPAEDVPMIPPGSPVFCSASQAVRRRYEIQSLRESTLSSGQPVDIHVSLAPDGITAHAETTIENNGDVQADAFVPLALTPSRQTGQTPAAVRKAFERLGDTAWQLGALTLDDPHACYAPPSKLNEARRAVIEKLSDAWRAARANRLAAIVAAWMTGESAATTPTDAADHWSLKLRSDTSPFPTDTYDGIETLVLMIGHTPLSTLEKQLADWVRVMERQHIRLALPLITREAEIPGLKDTLGRLFETGWTNWECADLAGYRLLEELGIAPVSSDWSLYAFNRVAVAELARLGIAEYVLSPENSLENIRALVQTRGPAPKSEILVFQHTPLFISETAPCLPQAESGEPITFTNRRGKTFTTLHLDHHWITISNSAFCIADRVSETGTRRFRIDLSWSPSSADCASLVRALRSGHLPPHTHAANFDRGFA